MSIISGEGQTSTVDSVLSPVTVELTDPSGAAVVSQALTVAPSAGAGVDVSTYTTDSNGLMTFTPWLGREAGPATYVVSGLGASTTVHATATALATNTLYSVVNPDAVSGYAGVPGAGTRVNIATPRGIAAASDGTVYFAASGPGGSVGYVLRLSPAGDVSVVAGNGTANEGGDTGPAADAGLYYPYGLALDEAHGLLYVALGDRVRVVNLSSGAINLFAGTGPVTSPGYGDNGPATSAALNATYQVEVGPDGKVYLGDSYRNGIRRVDPATGLITTWLSPATTGHVGIAGCGEGYASCGVAWDGEGNAFVSSYVSNGSSNLYGIVRFDVDAGSPLLVAGETGGSTGDDVQSNTAVLKNSAFMAFDSAKNLFYADPTDNRIRRIEGGTLRVTTVTGSGTAGFAGDQGDASQGVVNAPGPMAFVGNDLYFADTSNNAIRSVSGVGVATPVHAALSVVSGDAQTVFVDALANTLVAKIADGAGSPLTSWTVGWTIEDSGSYLFAPSSVSNLTGRASNTARPGLLPGAYRLEASFNDLHGQPATNSPLTFTVNAAAPDAGTILTAVNVDAASGFSGFPGPGTEAHVSGLDGVAVASDGTIYFATGNSSAFILQLSPAGQLTILAGNGNGGQTGDSGPALQATLNYPYGLALDEPNGLLYASFGDRIRVIDLDNKNIYLFAGTGTAGSPGYGDNGNATSAALSGAYNVAVDANGLVYIGDQNRNAIRRVDLSGIITTWLNPVSGVGNVGIAGCRAGVGACSVSFDPSGNAYVGSSIDNGTSTVQGVIRVDPTGSNPVWIAGASSGSTANGVAATTAAFLAPPHVAFDPVGTSGSLVVSDTSSHLVRLIDISSGLITTIAGTGTLGYSGDYGPGTAAKIDAPAWVATSASGHVFIADNNNNALREVW